MQQILNENETEVLLAFFKLFSLVKYILDNLAQKKNNTKSLSSCLVNHLRYTHLNETIEKNCNQNFSYVFIQYSSLWSHKAYFPKAEISIERNNKKKGDQGFIFFFITNWIYCAVPDYSPLLWSLKLEKAFDYAL